MATLSAAALRQAILNKERTAAEVCEGALAQIEALDRDPQGPALHAFQSVLADRARARAAALDRQRTPAGPLHGVPIALKDNILVRGSVTTAGSRMLEDFVSPYDATVVQKLEEAGAVIVGKTTCDEFAMGSSTENSAFGPARNPADPSRTPGGSSGGSAVAVAAGMTPLALGSDTGGSIRQPAALTGVVGVKPTYGRVSRYGLIAFASSLDQIGPFATTVADAALALEVIAGGDTHDATSAQTPVPRYTAALTGSVRGTRIGVPSALLEDGVDAEVKAAFVAATARMASLGATIVDVDLPHSRHAIPVYYLIATAEASSNLARYDGVRYGLRVSAPTLASMYERTRARGFGAEVKRRIMLGTYALSAGYYDAYYLKAQQVRTLIRRDFDAAFGAVDTILMPTSPVPAFKFGERVDDPLQMYLADVFTVSANLAGIPGISVPCGRTAAGLPVGMQFLGKPWDEATILRCADAYERSGTVTTGAGGSVYSTS
ncbi:MAG: Asp-tRNA(Asn)/Glu-tRNA(Gln) amidotransferase subunit GatA [Acidobacteria bacterium]|nr:MAG: Asp-tRNA(Asn)/Glu-tRNA(Gln) amidotransferase subunit GatA [Acidobacteriota bacterium]